MPLNHAALRRILRRILILAFAVLLGAAIARVADARAYHADGDIRPGRSVLVFHDIDFVGAVGYRAGDPMRVDVFRGEHRVGGTAGRAQSTPDGGGLEVNHGVDTAVPGDCWQGTTPDLQPYDRIVVTDPSGEDELLVDDVRLTQGPTQQEDGSVTLEGHASFADGTPIPLGALHGEVRNTATRVRAETATVERIPAEESGRDDAFRVVYRDTNPGAYTVVKPGGPPSAALTQSILTADEHTAGYGHIEPLPPETQMADFGGAHGPALGCGQLAPAAAPDAITSRDDEVVNRDSGDLELGGTAAAGTTAVQLTIDDTDDTTAPVVAETVPERAPNAPADADQGWSLVVSRDALDGLPDGTLTITATFSSSGPAASSTVAVTKDTVAPVAPAADPAPGTHTGSQLVLLQAEAGGRVHVTQDGSPATTASPRQTAVQVDNSRTLRAIAVDAAGNVSPEAVLDYVIVAPPPVADAAPAPVADPVPPAAPGLPPAPAPAPVPQAAPVIRAPAAPQPLRVGRLTVGARQALASVRRRGINARVVAPAGTGLVEIALYRLEGKKRALVGRRSLQGVAGVNLVGLAPKTLRRSGTGRYEVVVRVGRRSGALGPAVRAAVRIVA